MIIAVDFDGTCVTHEYPDVGEDIGAAPVLRKLVESGHKLILWTMRSGRFLMDAKEWFDENKIELWGINCNPEQKSWTESPKAYAQLYIDDAAYGAPLLLSSLSSRSYFNWPAVLNEFKESGVIK
jgi:hydroxymethylpyrimidine pyrophosphatase-like HAD family hydrolase